MSEPESDLPEVDVSEPEAEEHPKPKPELAYDQGAWDESALS